MTWNSWLFDVPDITLIPLRRDDHAALLNAKEQVFHERTNIKLGLPLC